MDVSDAKREAVAHLCWRFKKSERRTSTIIGADRRTIHYQSRHPPKTEPQMRLRDLANERRRFGYRCLFVLLKREGELSGINHIYRLYHEEGLVVCKHKGRKRAVGTRTPQGQRPLVGGFGHDQMASRRRPGAEHRR